VDCSKVGLRIRYEDECRKKMLAQHLQTVMEPGTKEMETRKIRRKKGEWLFVGRWVLWRNKVLGEGMLSR
jgi:hypothetical protein